MTKSYQLLVFIIIDYVLYSGGLQVTVTRQTRYGDLFSKTSCKTDCSFYGGYCFDTRNPTCCSCQCEWGKTFYGIESHASCVNILQTSFGCNFQVVGSLNQELYSVLLSKDKSKDPYQSIGSLELINPASKSKSCSLLSDKSSYWEPLQWNPLFTEGRIHTDILLTKKGTQNILEIKVSSSELYKGLLIKLFLSCENFASCFLFKVLGERTYNEVKPITNTTKAPLISKTKVVSTPKIKNNLIILIVAAAALIIITAVILLVLRKKKLKRKKLSLPDRTHPRDASQIQLINNEFLRRHFTNSPNDGVRTYDESAYIDPSICLKSRDEKMKNPDYVDPNVPPTNMVNKVSIPSYVEPNFQTTGIEEKKNHFNYVDLVVSSEKIGEKKSDSNYEYPLLEQLPLKYKHEKNEYESCGNGAVSSTIHEYVDISSGSDGKFHYYTDPEKILQEYNKNKQSKHVKTSPEEICLEDKVNSGYAKLLQNNGGTPLLESNGTIPLVKHDHNITTKDSKKYASLLLDPSDTIVKENNSMEQYGDVNFYPAGYARLTISSGNKAPGNESSETSPKYYQLEVDPDNSADEIAI